MTTEAPGLLERFMSRCIDHPGLVVVLVLAGAALGLMWARDLPRDVFPDLAVPVFNVSVQNPAMGPEELEAAVAIPIETSLAGLPDVRRIRSSSQPGVTVVTVELEPDADYYRSRQLVAERVSQVAPQLPPGTAPPLVSSLTTRLNEVLELTLEADPGTVDLMALRDLAEVDVRIRLMAVPGVAAVEILGGYLRELQVQLDPERMAVRAISLDEVLHAVEGANVNASGGFVVQGPMEWNIRAVGRARSVEDIRATVVALRGGTPVVLGDVADVREGPAVRRGMAHRLKGEIVSGRVIKQFGADTVKVADAVRAVIPAIQSGLPPGVQLRVVYDQSTLIRAALSGVGRAILLGAVFVILVLFGLLGDARAAAVVTLTIPLSIALAGLVLEPAGVGINTMTLGGLAIAVGLLVDAAIIVTENVLHRLTLERHADRRRVARAAAIQMGRPIAFATLIVIAVFLPLFGMRGLEGRMYQPLGAAVIATVAGALLLALSFVPVLSAALLRPRPVAEREDVWLVRAIKTAYAPLLDACLRHAGAVRIASLLVTIPALGLALRIGSDFMPRIDEGALLLQTMLPPEASLDEVNRLNHRVEDVLRDVPDVEDVIRRTGRGERTEDPMPHTVSDILIVLRPDRRHSGEALAEAVRARVRAVPGIGALLTSPLGMRIDEGLGGTPADVSVRIFGPDLDELTRLADRAREIIAGVAGVADLRQQTLTGLPQLRIEVDRAAAARAGLTPADVIRAVRIGMAGEAVSQVWVGPRRHDLVVRLQDHHRRDSQAVRSLLVDGHDGTRIPLGHLAAIEETFGPNAIPREAGMRRIAVDATVTGRDLGSTAREIDERLQQGLALPPGYFVTVGGRVELQARAARGLMVALALAVLAVLVLLYLALGSFAETLVILATLPDALVGAIIALRIAGETWNVSSLVGLIGLFGIAVQNGLVLITQTRALVAGGRPFPEALREASIGRVRPKLMTAGTAILGLLPLVVLRLHGTEIERPLATVMIGGLVTSTLFTLLALPTFYLLVSQWATHRSA